MKPTTIPYHSNPSPTGIFIRRIEESDPPEGRHESHRDNYYIIALLTAGSARGMVDFQGVSIAANQAMIIAPAQVHAMQSYAPDTRGWMMALGEELFAAEEMERLAEYALQPLPFGVDAPTMAQLNNMLELSQLHTEIPTVAHHCVAIVKALLLHRLPTLSGATPNRYLRITVEFNRLLKARLAEEKRPSAYASMMNISEVYLN